MQEVYFGTDILWGGKRRDAGPYVGFFVFGFDGKGEETEG